MNKIRDILLGVLGIMFFIACGVYAITRWKDLVIGTIILFIVFILFNVYVYYINSKGDTKKEKLKESLIRTKDEIKKETKSFFESSESKKLREAENVHKSMLCLRYPSFDPFVLS